ncbi:MAG: hypothetical protein ILA17_11250 [Ruminococcus sp.]|nr:hypothetical protein [Ruminococcus sp.]
MQQKCCFGAQVRGAVIPALPAAEGERTGECFNAAKVLRWRAGERAAVHAPPAAEGERTGGNVSMQ